MGNDVNICSVLQEIQSLQQKLREKELMLEWPEHEKDREIQFLKAKLAAHNRVQATQHVLCNSLADEAEQLRGQLGTTVRVCEELLGRLEKQKNLPATAEYKTQVNEVCVRVWEWSDVTYRFV